MTNHQHPPEIQKFVTRSGIKDIEKTPTTSMGMVVCEPHAHL
ncbi:hypothetical protein X805_18990 [Sphaerotilus natans subsp. natans DSM 6575]|uniref:Uncharacterized protein n=1 Tax=Sphaerotilus natans subsp. natans DSM 6575 TaxID=1286631 RepID=A0A059KM72_9BURK|nr:hypothetical protein X805_18990 [Sphaerotilus natans subsp. natans DSM 6575]